MTISVNEFCSKLELEFEEVDPGTFTPDVNFKQTFIWNSINALILMAHVSAEYRVVISAEDLQKCVTLRSLYDLVQQKEMLVS